MSELSGRITIVIGRVTIGRTTVEVREAICPVAKLPCATSGRDALDYVYNGEGRRKRRPPSKIESYRDRDNGVDPKRIDIPLRGTLEVLSGQQCWR